MIGKAVAIATPDGTMDGYAARPDGPGKFALVVLYMDIWGLREELFAIARRIASHPTAITAWCRTCSTAKEKSATSAAMLTAG